MVTEKDLYQNIRIDCAPKNTKNKTRDFYIYDMKNEALIEEDRKINCSGYSISTVLYHINRGTWKISHKYKNYELW